MTFARRLLALLALVPATAAAADPSLLTGDRLVLQAGRTRALQIVSSDAAIALGRANGSPDDPVVASGSLRIVTFKGDVFDATYPLPADRWRYLGRKGDGKGYRFLGKVAVRSIVVKPGRLLRITAKGKLDQSLGSDPDPVQVVLTFGAQQYCLSFGGETIRSRKRYVAAHAPAPEVCPLAYADDALWLCRPGKADNECLTDLDATVIHPDLSTSTEPHTGAAEDHPYDCFYVYPTVDLTGPVGNHTDFSDLSLMLDPLVSQAARLNGSCRLFAPLYRQITIGTYNDPMRDHYLDIAYGDVESAFRRYLAKDNGGRNVVIMGHSQGTQMVTRLMQDFVDPDPALRARLIVGLLIGGGVVVPEGQVVGGTFANVPLCTTDAQTGCAIAYRSYAEGFPPANGSNVQDAAMDTACTNPAALGGGVGLFAKTYFPNHVNQPLFQIVPDPGFGTPFSLYEGFYSGQCVKDDHGKSYLQISVTPGPGDLRTNPVPFGNVVFAPSFLGTHILDYNWPMGDLIRLVTTKAAAMPSR